MTQEEEEILELLKSAKADYAGLLSLCKSGPARTTPVPDDKLKKAIQPGPFGLKLDFSLFCAICAANAPEIDFLLKLFSLQDGFAEQAPAAPLPGDDASAQVYLSACAESLREEVTRRVEFGELDPAAVAYAAVQNYGAHFIGKLIHSKAEGAALLAPSASTSQPHVSSRSLAAVGIHLMLDQDRNDNRGIYQQVVKVLNRDPVVGRSRVPSFVIEALESGAVQAIQQGAKPRPSFVDAHLRQILLPSGEEYLSVSPLAAGGWCVLMDQAVSRIERAQFLREQERLQEGEALRVTEAPKKKGRKPKGEAVDTAQDANANEESPRVEGPRRLFIRLEFPVGGANPFNVTLHNKAAVQNPLYFEVPQRQIDLRRAWSFVSTPVRLWVSRSEMKAFRTQHERLQTYGTLGQSSSLAAIEAQSSGALAALVYRLHREMMALSALVAESEYPDEAARVAIDETLLRAKRKQPPEALDLCIVQGHFGRAYRTAMSQAIVHVLARRMVDEKTKAPLLGGVDRERIRRAVESLLESA